MHAIPRCIHRDSIVTLSRLIVGVSVTDAEAPVDQGKATIPVISEVHIAVPSGISQTCNTTADAGGSEPSERIANTHPIFTATGSFSRATGSMLMRDPAALATSSAVSGRIGDSPVSFAGSLGRECFKSGVFSGVPSPLGAPTGARGGSTVLQAAFEERVQQLTVLGSVSGGFMTSVADRARFDWELRNYHAVDVDAVADLFGSSVSMGLTPDAAAAALKRDGPNILTPPRDWPLTAKLAFAMVSGFAPLLWVGVVTSFIAWQPLGGDNPSPYSLGLAVLLMLIIVVGGVFVFWQEYQTARVLAGFKSMLPTVAQVTRGGAPLSVPAADLAVGDLVTLSPGTRVPADVRLVEAHSLKIDNSMLTGEATSIRLYSEPQVGIRNSLEARNMAFMGTTVTEGSGSAVVVAVGDRCQLGRIAEMASALAKMAPLQADLNRFVVIVTFFAVFFFVLILVVWGAWIKPQHYSFMPSSAALTKALVRPWRYSLLA